MNILARVIKDVTTIADGKSFCYAKVHGWIAFFMGTGISAYTAIENKTMFDFKDFCIGTSALIGAVGAAILMKKKDEPNDTGTE